MKKSRRNKKYKNRNRNYNNNNDNNIELDYMQETPNFFFQMNLKKMMLPLYLIIMKNQMIKMKKKKT